MRIFEWNGWVMGGIGDGSRFQKEGMGRERILKGGEGM
jgi:hypothetical protein